MNITIDRKPIVFFIICIFAMATGIFISSGSKITALPFLLIGYFVWWKFSLRYKLSTIIILICFNETFFKLINAGPNKRFINDIALVLMVFLILPQVSVVLNFMNKKYELYGKYIILYWLVIFISLTAGSYFVFGQPVLTGMIPARRYLFLISYFFLAAIGCSLNDFSKFMRFISIFGTALAALILIDVHILGGGVIFDFIPDEAKLRVGSIRFSTSSFIVVVACIYNYICSRESIPLGEKFFYTGMSFVCFFEILICNMTRARIVGLLFVLLLIHIKKIDFKKFVILASLFATLSLLPNMANIPLIPDRLNKLYTLSQSDLQQIPSNKGNINIRINEFYYFTKLWLTKSPIFGVGVFSDTHFSKDPMNSAELQHNYHISDIRIMDTFVRFGLPGIIILISLYMKLFSNIKRLWCKCTKQEHILLSTVLYILIYTLLTPTLGTILTNNLMYYGMFLYYISLLNQKYADN